VRLEANRHLADQFGGVWQAHGGSFKALRGGGDDKVRAQT